MNQIFHGQPQNRTTTGAVGLAGQAIVMTGFYVNSTTAGTLTFASLGTITPAIGWHFYPAVFPVGCSVTVGGVIDVTFILHQD